MVRNLENYDFDKDTEHVKLFGNTLPANRDEEIQRAGTLANLTGKRVRINAMSIVPSKQISHGERIFHSIANLIFGLFVLIMLIGLIVAVLAMLNGQI